MGTPIRQKHFAKLQFLMHLAFNMSKLLYCILHLVIVMQWLVLGKSFNIRILNLFPAHNIHMPGFCSSSSSHCL